MDALEKKWMIIWFLPNQHPSKMNVLPRNVVQIILSYMSSAAFKYFNKTAATTFAFSSVCFFFYVWMKCTLRPWAVLGRAEPTLGVGTHPRNE